MAASFSASFRCPPTELTAETQQPPYSGSAPGAAAAPPPPQHPQHPQHPPPAAFHPALAPAPAPAPAPTPTTAPPPPRGFTPAHAPGAVESLTRSVKRVGGRARDATNNLWNHLSTGQAAMRTAMGKLHNVSLLTPSSAQQFWRSNMLALGAFDALVDHFACHLATPAGPAPGTLFVGTHSVSFLSDRPLSIAPPGTAGQPAASMHKILLPVEQMASIAAARLEPPNVNPQRPSEQRILIAMADGREESFFGFVNFDQALSLLHYTHPTMCPIKGDSTPPGKPGRGRDTRVNNRAVTPVNLVNQGVNLINRDNQGVNRVRRQEVEAMPQQEQQDSR
eukprot:jgi/Mesen1/6275/ME000324S05320